MSEENKATGSYLKSVLNWVTLGLSIAFFVGTYITAIAVQGTKINSNTARITKLEQADADLRHDVEKIVDKSEGRLVYQIDRANTSIIDLNNKLDRVIENIKKE